MRPLSANESARISIITWVIIPISDIPQFQPGNIRSSDTPRPIARERKDLTDYISIIPWARVGYEVIKITNERVARVGYNHFISNKGEWNNCFSKFSNRVLPPIFIFHNFTKRPGRKFLNLAHYFPYDVKLRLLAHSRSFLANQKARNAIVGAENLLKCVIYIYTWIFENRVSKDKGSFYYLAIKSNKIRPKADKKAYIWRRAVS